MAVTPCSTNPTSRDLPDVVGPISTDILVFIPTPVADDTFTDVDGDPITVTVWLEFHVSITGVQVDYGLGSGIEFPSWLSFQVINNVAGPPRTADVEITINMATYPVSVDYTHIGIRIDDGVNPPVDDFFCFESPYEL